LDHCRQCGTCCRKGGPAIHQEDKILLENGHIPFRYLFTIRKDEPVYDNVQGCIISAWSDIIRIKSLENSNTCVFFNSERNNCTIYDNRPKECRTLECWNTREIEEIYSKGHLSRQELLTDLPDINQLMKYHENRCAYQIIKRLIHQLDQDNLDQENKENILNNIRELLAFDNHFRSLAIEKSVCKTDIMEFLFGSPLHQTLPRMGLKVIRKKDGYCLIPATRFTANKSVLIHQPF
jgi:Fe-S-cluster containining protein